MANKQIYDLPAITTPADADAFPLQRSALGGQTSRILFSSLMDAIMKGWAKCSETFTYAASDSPVFTATVPGDVTSKYKVGMKFWINQTTDKYFFLVAISYSSPNTTFTFYGGTDYSLVSGTISAAYYSTAKAPFGFPMNPAKWTVVASDANNQTASPNIDVWTNLGNFYVDIPIGEWRVYYEVSIWGAAAVRMMVTLSTANNSESDSDFTSNQELTSTYTAGFIHREKHLAVTSKTRYYLNTINKTASGIALYNMGARSKTIIRAVCAYL